jgi:hypothetical protein
MLQSKNPKKAKHAAPKSRAKRPLKLAQDQSRPVRSGTKQEAVLALLRQPAGTTIDAMMKATGWQSHSVRGFLTGVVRKRLKLKLESTAVDGNRVYHVACDAPSQQRKPQSKRRAA